MINIILNYYELFINIKDYDFFLNIITKDNYICIEPITKIKSFGSDNEQWCTNFLLKIFINLTNYTSIPVILIENIIVNIFIFLIKTNNNNLKNYLIYKINQMISSINKKNIN